MKSKTIFGDALTAKPFTSPTATELPTDEKIRALFVFHMATMKAYIDYSQEVEGQGKSQLKERINPIINALVEKHKFGSKFSSDLTIYLNSKFIKPASTVIGDIRKEAESIPDDVFNSMIDDFKKSPLMSSFSSKFRNLLS